ncbi:hypothetical protein [Arcanobacterium buesumense]|uniref:Gram-positive cocci surface proteins LPxTG domain-containing protein n=1 Tax=Arcanobacterium buesumense TaxID=2722751 RepID=A0A6H2EJZ5_9ACTO|nr:hypothetical protein [Arcanobacterium buesumense]QJC21520.1 hypothetical protein HC352_02655 [Arcanobacterium buesumense]
MKNFKKAAAFGLAFAFAGFGAVAPAFAANEDLESAVRTAQLDVDYFCTETAPTYDMAKCAIAEDDLAKAKKALEDAAAAPKQEEAPAVNDNVHNAQIDVDWFCTEGTEYYDMKKCKDAQQALEDAKDAGKETTAPSGDSVKNAIKDKELTAEWKCAEGSEYYDFNECANLNADLKDLRIKDALLDIDWFCTEGTEYYDMAKCADAKDRLAKLPGATKVPNSAPTVDDSKEAWPMEELTPATETTPAMKLTPAKKAAEEAKKGELAKTGIAAGALAGIAALSTLGGAAAIRRRNA